MTTPRHSCLQVGHAQGDHQSGYRILANVGDQQSDLSGGYARGVQAAEPDVLHALAS